MQREFWAGYYDETYHYPVAQHLKEPDILQLGYLGIFENIDRQDVKTRSQKFSPVWGATAPYK